MTPKSIMQLNICTVLSLSLSRLALVVRRAQRVQFLNKKHRNIRLMTGRPSTNQYKIKYIEEQNSGKTLAHLGLIPGSHIE